MQSAECRMQNAECRVKEENRKAVFKFRFIGMFGIKIKLVGDGAIDVPQR